MINVPLAVIIPCHAWGEQGFEVGAKSLPITAKKALSRGGFFGGFSFKNVACSSSVVLLEFVKDCGFIRSDMCSIVGMGFPVFASVSGSGGFLAGSFDFVMGSGGFDVLESFRFKPEAC